jgi:hypothetical protein
MQTYTKIMPPFAKKKEEHDFGRKTMKRSISPLVATVVFAAAAGLLLAAVACLPLRSVHRPIALNLSIFLCLAAYSAFLVRSSGRNLRDLFAPLFLLAAVLAAASSVAGFALPAAAGLSWIRSAICFPGSMARRAGAEAITCTSGLILIWLLQPPGPYGWALGIWMFGLVQALYFVAVDVQRTSRSAIKEVDMGTMMHRRAEALFHEQKLARAFEELGLQ